MLSLAPVHDTKLLIPLGFPDAGNIFGSYGVTHGGFQYGGGQQKNQALIGRLESSASFSILWGDETGNQITDWSVTWRSCHKDPTCRGKDAFWDREHIQVAAEWRISAPGVEVGVALCSNLPGSGLCSSVQLLICILHHVFDCITNAQTCFPELLKLS